MKNKALPVSERLWRAVRSLRGFTAPDLMLMAGSDRAVTVRFCRRMLACGYTAHESIFRTAVRGRMPRYRLAKDPGPLLPAELNLEALCRK